MKSEPRRGKWTVKCPKCKRKGELRKYKNGSAIVRHQEKQLCRLCKFSFWP